MREDAPITDLLAAWTEGDRHALDEIMELIYTELRARARKAMAGERSSHTLEPTAVAHEVYLRLRALKKGTWENRARFFAFIARLIRQILIEHARAVGAKKRGGEVERVLLESAELPAHAPPIDALVLNEALEKLEAADPQLARIIELRFFTGLTEEETAEVLGVSRSSVQREWAVAKRFLARFFDGSSGEEER